MKIPHKVLFIISFILLLGSMGLLVAKLTILK